ncbi:hypothetical protein GGI09_000872 [Coemansia sp. S100]|nr:hypothetical protein LPJ71_002471 [Coemansia sp. S17]KAJ2103051.1 hypothetical protein GGI09_000872 [Coemansia sp. S100]KAJ2109954.1 hypothetical protein GGI16_000516 [Coemansia sp. S142-1]
MSTSTTTMTPEKRVSKLFEILEISGKKEHISGNMTQLDHALRVANLAKVEGADEDTILAALMLNTRGITVAIPPYDNVAVGDRIELFWNGYDMDTSDTIGSDEFDNTFARKLGFSNKTSELVESNTLTKRYLGSMTPEGLESIIPKSMGIITREDLVAGVRVTIPMWGGPLSPTEMHEFEKDSLFKRKVQLAVWDVAATKTTGDKPPALDTYRDMAIRNLLMSMVTLY